MFRSKTSNRARVSLFYAQFSVQDRAASEAEAVDSTGMINAESIAQLVARAGPFGILDEHDMDTIVASVVVKEFQDGEVIIKQGTKGDAFYIMEKGHAVVRKRKVGSEVAAGTVDDDGFGNTVIPANRARPVAFGEMSLLDGSERNATVTAQVYCRCLVIDRETYIRYANKAAELVASQQFAVTAHAEKDSSEEDRLQSLKEDAVTRQAEQEFLVRVICACSSFICGHCL